VDERDALLKDLPGIKQNLKKALDIIKRYLADHDAIARSFATVETSYMGSFAAAPWNSSTATSGCGVPGAA
jgi:hypothetical protein